jgi:hypothetical protein
VRALLVAGLLLPATARADSGKVEVGGRVFARGETVRLQGEEDFATQGSIASARAEAKYEWEWLRTVIEVEFRDGADLKDAYIRATSDPWRGQAGQFKEPISAMMMESGWNLPVAERGFLHEIVTDRMQIGFRHPGLMGTWRGAGDLEPRVSLGVFQGTAPDGDPRPDLLKTAARAQVELGPVEVAGFFEHRDTQPVIGLETERFWCAGADAVVELAGLRAWVDFMVGSSWIDAAPSDDAEPTFVLVRGIAAYRFGGEDDGRFYVEPYLHVGGLDPDLDIREDLLSELSGGVNIGAWDRVRLQIEVERWGVQRNTPSLFGARDRLAFLAQIGAAF